MALRMKKVVNYRVLRGGSDGIKTYERGRSDDVRRFVWLRERARDGSTRIRRVSSGLKTDVINACGNIE